MLKITDLIPLREHAIKAENKLHTRFIVVFNQKSYVHFSATRDFTTIKEMNYKFSQSPPLPLYFDN